MATAASATPSVYQVFDVPAGDTLNVRAGPMASSSDLGDLANGKQVEIISTSVDGKWGNFIWQEANGWVAMRYLKPVETPTHGQSDLPLGLSCSGTEPFWSLTFAADGSIKYDALDGEAFRHPSFQSVQHLGPFQAQYGFASGLLSGYVAATVCSDGMSDRTYGWAIQVLLQGDTLRSLNGCCTIPIR